VASAWAAEARGGAPASRVEALRDLYFDQPAVAAAAAAHIWQPPRPAAAASGPDRDARPADPDRATRPGGPHHGSLYAGYGGFRPGPPGSGDGPPGGSARGPPGGGGSYDDPFSLRSLRAALQHTGWASGFDGGGGPPGGGGGGWAGGGGVTRDAWPAGTAAGVGAGARGMLMTCDGTLLPHPSLPAASALHPAFP
jgi:hypothetical protein